MTKARPRVAARTIPGPLALPLIEREGIDGLGFDR